MIKGLAIAKVSVVALFGAVVIVAIVAAISARGGSTAQPDRTASGGTVTIHDSYNVDVTNLGVLVDHTSDVFVGQVVAIERVDSDRAVTTYRVKVTETINGSRAGGVLLANQLGYIDEEGTTHQLDDQPLLEIGSKYLLATNYDVERSAFTVSAGPLSVRPITSATQQAELSRQYTAAVGR